MLVITADELMRGGCTEHGASTYSYWCDGFELFIGIIQAFVFALLTTIYIGMTIAHH